MNGVYKLSDEAVKRLFKAGQDYKNNRTVTFELTDLSEDARAKWLEMYGTYENVKLRYFRIYGGQIYDDGSVSKDEPYITDSLDWFVQDQILTPQSINDVVSELHKQYKKLEKYLPKWKKARSEYEKKTSKGRS